MTHNQPPRGRRRMSRSRTNEAARGSISTTIKEKG